MSLITFPKAGALGENLGWIRIHSRKDLFPSWRSWRKVPLSWLSHLSKNMVSEFTSFKCLCIHMCSISSVSDYLFGPRGSHSLRVAPFWARLLLQQKPECLGEIPQALRAVPSWASWLLLQHAVFFTKLVTWRVLHLHRPSSEKLSPWSPPLRASLHKICHDTWHCAYLVPGKHYLRSSWQLQKVHILQTSKQG